MGTLIRALPMYFSTLPYAVAAAALVAVIAWLVWRSARQRVQFVLTSLAYGAGTLFVAYPLMAGMAFFALGGDSREAAYQAQAVAVALSALLLVLMLGVGFVVRDRKTLAGALLGVGYAAVLLLITVPMTIVRGG